MASLRNLLDKPTEGDIRRVPTYMGEDGYQYLWRGTHCGWGCIDSSAHNRLWHCTCWCIPDLNICRIKFEVWGAGGMSTGWRCRGMTWTGGSGEYKARTICAANWAGRETGYFDGMCLQMQAAEPRCCATCGGACTGCESWICTENNYTICSRGGCGGLYEGACFCYSMQGYHMCRGCFWSDFNWCNHYNDGGPARNRASENYPCNWCDIQKCCGGDGRNTSVPGCGCCYHPGSYGGTVHYSPNDGYNACAYAWQTGYPAGLNSTHGGFVHQGGQTDCCCMCWSCAAHMLFHKPGYWPGGTDTEYNGSIGMGGSAPGNGGGESVCRCGGPGAGGAIRLTLYPDTSV